MIAIIGAMAEEVAELKKLLSDVSKSEISGYNFYQGTCEHYPVVLMQSGVGKVLSASSTTVLLENFDIDYVINIGTAGGIASTLKPLDVVISDKVALADFDLRAFGYGLSFEEERVTFECDRELFETAKDLKLEGINLMSGNMVTTDAFIHQPTQVEDILENFPSTLCADMESASIAMVLKQYEIPFIIIRSISDVVTNPDNQMDFDDYLKVASKNSALITRQFILNQKNS